MVRAIADVLGVQAVTVSQYDRQLAEAGFRTKGGRGPSAAQVTAADVANLLIAILGSPVSGASIRAAAQVCEEIGSKRRTKAGSNLDVFAEFGLRSLASLPDAHTFREAIAALIEGAGRGEPVRLANLDHKSDYKFDLRHLDVTVRRPHPIAIIRIIGRERRGWLEYFSNNGEPDAKNAHPIDLSQERTVSNLTFEVLGKLVANTEDLE
jgi:hypothetical protein